MGRDREKYPETGVSNSKEVERLKKKMKMKKQMRKRRITALIITLIIGAIVGGGIYIYTFLSGLNSSSLPGAIDPIGKNPVNILMLGLDIGDANQEKEKVGQRTDTMMVLNYNPATKKAQIVSIPRDTMIEVDGTNDGKKTWKMNAAYAIDGEKEVTLQVEKLLDIKINYMVKVDYSAFRKIVDAIGGVEMYIENDMYYDDDLQNLHINFKKGETVNLDGKKAEEFVRWRENNDGTGLPNGDIDRIAMQHKFITKAIEKCMSPSVVVKIPKILKAVGDSIDTNLDPNQMVKYALEMVKLNKEDIVMSTLQGESKYIYDKSEGKDISYFIYDKEMNSDLLKSLHSGEIGSSTSNGSGNNVDTSQIELKSNLKIMVLNATSVNGLAGELQAKLDKLGYGNVEIGNTPEPADKSVIMTDNKDIKEILKTDTEIKKLGKNSDSEYAKYDAVIILGKDYDLFGE